MKEYIEQAVANYSEMQELTLKVIFFDMDGVLYNSMPYHVKAWHSVFKEFGLEVPVTELYLNEGATAYYTVKKLFRKYAELDATHELAEKIKDRKHEVMAAFPDSDVMPEMQQFLKSVTESNIDSWVVTGSGQKALLDRLEFEFNGSLFRDKMVTAFDVKNGKPNPEPYLKAIEKSGYAKNEAIVIENAPLGIMSAKAAGLFTIAINTGPLDIELLKEAGADIAFQTVDDLLSSWEHIYNCIGSKSFVSQL